jgi:hypothetical protein
MITFLFWNMCRRPLQDAVANLARRHQADVVVLGECNVDPSAMLMALNPRDTAEFQFSPSRLPAVDIAIYTRFPGLFLVPYREDRHFTIRRLCLPEKPEILVVAAHLRSKLYRSYESQTAGCIDFADMVREAEDDLGHRRTVLLGDLNMNPFEAGVVGASGLHGVMTREIAARGHRTVEGKRYPFFYNPMWGMFGDATDGPAGTYYRDSAEHVATFWSIYDQILLRPALVPFFDSRSLMILSTDGTQELVREGGIPNRSEFSDHLPITFQLGI